ncbi:hypothetical protein, unlikely [Trypanosoma brucei gambiense DAL972]|uniref:Uncharacterized protein n=1 Tax=Trypanosoma brucei gambiense (strain MHOM/CI/86/DAL972) TaxID=679716 RepID=C9ZU46_TRYB9|nr:hypothetical protein, unlikely [Trypanosoma brucei gambiense DAL972]CBH12932.1 hypothetical protein, unlikely [Trypanosoma brucei gambiense DAL972]|eukprot:XP_011775211.1 hypothetical protein, unlikely [Trypanosoma brucei gambiense DAL972]
MTGCSAIQIKETVCHHCVHEVEELSPHTKKKAVESRPHNCATSTKFARNRERNISTGGGEKRCMMNRMSRDLRVNNLNSAVVTLVCVSKRRNENSMLLHCAPKHENCMQSAANRTSTRSLQCL